MRQKNIAIDLGNKLFKNIRIVEADNTFLQSTLSGMQKSMWEWSQKLLQWTKKKVRTRRTWGKETWQIKQQSSQANNKLFQNSICFTNDETDLILAQLIMIRMVCQFATLILKVVKNQEKIVEMQYNLADHAVINPGKQLFIK